MVKLKLSAIKQATPSTQTYANTTQAEVKRPAPVTVQKPVTLSTAEPKNIVKIAVPQAVIKKPIDPAWPIVRVKNDTKIETNTQPIKNKTPSLRTKMTLGWIKRIDPKIAIAAAKKAMPVKKKQEVFPIGASCELKNIELFPAYTSKFKKKQGSLLQEIKKLKRLPKTNKFFLLTLVWATMLGISMLFILAPEKHNLNYYKTSLIESYEKITTAKPAEILPEPVKEIDIEIPDLEIENIWDENNGEENDLWNENITDPKIEAWNDALIKDVEYYRDIKKQILGEKTVDQSSIEDSLEEDSSEEEESESINLDDTQTENISNTGSSENNNFEEFEDSFEGWRDEFLD